MSGAAALPGAELSSQKLFFLKNSLVRGSCAAWGRTFAQKSLFFEEATCLGQLRCLGQVFFSVLFLLSEISFFEEPTCLGQLRCLGNNFVSEISFWLGRYVAT